MKKKPPVPENDLTPKEDFSYPSSEDIYNQEQKVANLTAEDGTPLEEITKDKMTGWNEKDSRQEKTGDDLDVPGAELDDAQEEVGSEDEENNYYSLGADKEDGNPTQNEDYINQDVEPEP